jgi:hypothetical protein
MCAARDLWNNTTEPGMLINAGRDHICEQRTTSDDADRRLIARSFDTKYEWLAHERNSLRITIAVFPGP